MTALTRHTKAQLIALVERLTADNAQLTEMHNAATTSLDALRVDYVAIEERCVELDEQNDTLRTQFRAQRIEHGGLLEAHDVAVRDRDQLAALVAAQHDHLVSQRLTTQRDASHRKLREPNETELRRLAIIDMCHKLTKQHRAAVWYDWKYGEFRLRRNGAIQVVEAAQ